MYPRTRNIDEANHANGGVLTDRGGSKVMSLNDVSSIAG
jgi:enamine deaminase RidA (YjgF/YER057c/UK114 family)